MTSEEGKLIIAYKNLTTLPVDVCPPCGRESILTVDLSHNKISNIEFLKNFQNVSSVILDHNMIDASVVFPVLDKVELLWLNYNKIGELYPLVKNLRASFLGLKHLSLMGNSIVPACTQETYYQYLQYRLFVISWLPNLLHLDDRSVTQYERDEALRLFKRPLLERLPTVSLSKFFQNTFTNLKFFIDRPASSNQPMRYRAACVI